MLIWSADRFVDGASVTARHFSVSPLLVGMVIVGFGTSAPELVVSALAASQGNPTLALGNAWGSNIVNMGLVLGLTALITPIRVSSHVLRKELPLLLAATLLCVLLVSDFSLSRVDAWVLLLSFGGLMVWSIRESGRHQDDTLAQETAREVGAIDMSLPRSLFWLVTGFLVLVGSSRLLVWGAVEVAQALGISDLVIGLTVLALGTSLPELASCIAAARKGEDDIVLGNVLGSGLFNTLAVVGLAGAITPMDVEAAALSRDLPVMAGLTALVYLMGRGWRRPGLINRWEAGGLLVAYLAYTLWLLWTMGPR
ncbi:MAG: calcium/sodium antiporter [Hydrogenophaga sp.]|nr:calcium/sodium antiporter [Hydrogenophaga sp.]